jgi:hypothetical protein
VTLSVYPEHKKMQAHRDAVKAILDELGGASVVADYFGLTRQAVYGWTEHISVERACDLAAISGKNLSDIDPERFPIADLRKEYREWRKKRALERAGLP